MQTWMRNRHPITLALMWVSRRSWWRHATMPAAPDRLSWWIDLRHSAAHG